MEGEVICREGLLGILKCHWATGSAFFHGLAYLQLGCRKVLSRGKMRELNLGSILLVLAVRKKHKSLTCSFVPLEQSMAERWTRIVLTVWVLLSCLPAVIGEYQLSARTLFIKLCLWSHLWIQKLLLYFGSVLRHTSSFKQASPSYPTCFISGVVLHIHNM